MTARTHSLLLGWLAPVAALLAVPVGAHFLCRCGEHDARAVLVWQGTTLGLLGAFTRLSRFRGRPAVPAGLVGVLVWMALAPVFSSAMDGALGAVPVASSILVRAALALAAGSLAARLAERDGAMRASELPRALLPGAGLALSFTIALWLVGGLPSQSASPPSGQVVVVGRVELPALAQHVRERVDARSGLLLQGWVVRVGADGGTSMDVALGIPTSPPDPSDPVSAAVPMRFTDVCRVEVPPQGRSIEVVSTVDPDTLGLRWPTSPAGDVFGGCTFDRASLTPIVGGRPARRAAPEITWALGAAPIFALACLLGAWRLRRQHARIARSPEVEVTMPGLATLPDGTPAIVPSSLPLGARLVALRIADVRPSYRSDARTVIESLCMGQKPALLDDLARRVRALELLGLLGALLLASTALAAIAGGATLVFE